ncbi:DUF4350 domain-containing protein [Cesiribacter andamanensis]|uniref:DUF4350 domain-containing protein n=1 Tax=Cesiribacter andamanensis AMV16 TaxID=1279009 RepID=M7N5C5_9BACT|nr:DUF4350 domain-containing protein [Cesiribacter andamanensis]EMR02497.1 hypothetical protein ADICEAN_02370 [Cesiribacter andamanensis AMV16]
MSRRQLYILGGVLLVFVLIEALVPKPLNWRATYSQRDKNPYGAYALAQLLPDFLKEGAPHIRPVTLYELDSMPTPLNQLVLAGFFEPGTEDVEVLLRRVQAGDHAFLAAEHWNELLQDTLGFSYTYDFQFNPLGEQAADSMYLWFTQKGLPKEKYRYPATALASSFDSLPAGAITLALNNKLNPVLAAIPWGKGTIYLSSTPLAYTNYFLMQPQTRGFAEAALSYLPEQTPFWTEYYHLGRMESPSPLRFVLSEPALRWAYYLGMGVLLGFILFTLRRRQRPIPVVEPPANTSLQFAHTVARLYYGQQDHLNLAHKRIAYFMEELRERYQMPAGQPDTAWQKRLAHKSGHTLEEVHQLFAYINRVQQQAALSAQDLMNLNEKLDYFTRR